MFYNPLEKISQPLMYKCPLRDLMRKKKVRSWRGKALKGVMDKKRKKRADAKNSFLIPTAVYPGRIRCCRRGRKYRIGGEGEGFRRKAFQ